MRQARTTVLLAGLLLVAGSTTVLTSAAAGPAHPPPKVHLGWFSQQNGRSHASAGTQIDVSGAMPGHPHHTSGPTSHVAIHSNPGSSSSPAIGGTTDAPPQQPLYPPLPSSSPLLKSRPAGPGSFWYQDGAGHACMYAQDSVLPCFTLTGGGDPGAAAPPLTPATIAEHVADRLPLGSGAVKASPLQAGLTGAPSWFWLDPTPTMQQLSLTLAGEAVTVTAVPQISWQFGDGAAADGGAGVPYRAGAIPPAAVTHVYNTRCLPGDQGHDPYVLASCGGDGYQLTAAVSWQISYRATGPVATTGTLPTRTTTSSAAYPVSEARAFLVQGAAG